MRVLVVDDEELARRRLVRLLRERPEVRAIDEAADGLEALEALGRARPDVMLLDVRMPELDGIALAQRYADLPPIVFTTAFDEFALRAFEVGAVDYLLKPVRPERLAQALARVAGRAACAPEGTAGHGRAAVSAALVALAPGGAGPLRVVSTSRGQVRLFDPGVITRFWSADKYTMFHADGAEHLTEESLDALEERLRPLGFVRVHRGQLVRSDAIRGLSTVAGGYEVTLSDGQSAPVSRRSIAALRARLGLSGE